MFSNNAVKKIISLAVIVLINFFSQSIQAADRCDQIRHKKEYLFKKAISKKLESNAYFNLPISEFSRASDFEYLTFKVETTQELKGAHKLYLTIQDHLSQNYWTQLNHVVEVQKGKFDIFVDLKQIVGERGSQKKPRRINFSKLKKIFIVLDPDQSNSFSTTVSDFRFFTGVRPQFSNDYRVFDFRIKNNDELPCIHSIDELDKYSKTKGYGFKGLNLWRKEDSQYMDPFFRSVLFANEGEFAVDLPNGTYDVTFFWNSLGYWDPPFFSKRKVMLEDIPLRIQDRSEISDYERDYFVFEKQVPTLRDHPWDWLYERVMKPITKRIVISDKQLNLKFNGDASAVGLNGLIITNAKNPSQIKKGQAFIEDFKSYLKDFYDRKVRSSYKGQSPWTSKKAIAVLKQKTSSLSAFDDLSQLTTDVDSVLFAGKESTFVNLKYQNPFTGRIKLQWKSKNKKSPIELKPYKGMYQWVSLDRNHESYTLETQYLDQDNLEVNSSLNQQLFIEFSLKGEVSQKVFKEKGELIVEVIGDTSSKKSRWSFPLEVIILNETLPKLDIQAGFIGLNALKYSYFPSRQRLSRRRLWDEAYLKLMAKYGFNSFTGLPTNYESPKGLSFEEVSHRLSFAESLGFHPPYYSYGGEFLHQFFEENNLEGINKHKSALSTFLKKSEFQDIVFQFTDEAAGYSDNVDRDLERSGFLKKTFPRLKLGGFSHWQDSESAKLIELNKSLEPISLSKIGHSGLHWLQSNNKSWGLYNQAQGAREDVYKTFGRSLWNWSRKKGFTHYLEWHAAAIQNLPYFDLDGREADVAIAYPRADGKLNMTLKFIKAAEGLQDFRWLSYLSSKEAFSAREILKKEEKFTFRSSILGKLF